LGTELNPEHKMVYGYAPDRAHFKACQQKSCNGILALRWIALNYRNQARHIGHLGWWFLTKLN
jgi:uncharacterized membrane protein